MKSIPEKIQLLIRWSILLWGLLILIWLQLEDTSLIPVLSLAALICFIGSVALIIRLSSTKQLHLFVYPGIGAMAGLTLIPIALLLIAIKTSVHSHETPDFTTSQILSLIYRFPIMIGGGFFISLGYGLWQTTHQLKNP